MELQDTVIHPHETSSYSKFPHAVQFERTWFYDSVTVTPKTVRGKAFLDATRQVVLTGDIVFAKHSVLFLNYTKIPGLHIWIPNLRRKSIPDIKKGLDARKQERQILQKEIQTRQELWPEYGEAFSECMVLLEGIRLDILNHQKNLFKIDQPKGFNIPANDESYRLLGEVARQYHHAVERGLVDRSHIAPFMGK